MSKVEEKIKKYEKKSIVTLSGTDIEIVEKNTVLKDLKEIQAEQEDLRKKAGAYDSLASAASNTNTSIDAKRRREVEDKIVSYLKDFVEDSWRCDNAEESEPVVRHHACRIIELFEEHDKPVEVPRFIINTMKNYDSLQGMLIEEYYSNSTEEIDDDNVQCWIDDNFDLLCRAWYFGYTVKQRQQTHELKINIQYFAAVTSELKKFEIRKNDRDFQVNDILILKEFAGNEYTGREFKVKVIYITNYAQKENYVVLGIEPVKEEQG